MTKQEKVKALVEAFVNESYGTTLEHFKIAAIIDEPYGSKRYGEIVTRAKKELEDSGKMIVNVFSVGYRLAYPDEYVDQSVKRVKRGTNQIDQGVRILDNAPVKDMTQAGAQRYNIVTDRMRNTQAFIHGAKVEIKMLAKKRQNPLLAAAK